MDESLVLMLVAALLAGGAAKKDTTVAAKDGAKPAVAERYLRPPVPGVLWCRETKAELPKIEDINLDKPEQLPAEDHEKLKALADFLRKQDCGVRIEGYSDERGNDKAKKDRSQKRADTVKAYLTTKLTEASRVRAEQVDAVGKGEMHEADHTTREQKNVARIVF